MAGYMVGVNDRGDRVGESHVRAKLSDSLVNHLRNLHEHQGLGWRRLAELFTEIPPSTIQKIIAYERRAQTPTRWKRSASSAEDRRHA
jgi:hypothetical protein